MQEPSAYTTYNAIAIYHGWARRGKHRQLAAARYWLQYGIGESGCDHDYLREWLDRWWSRLPYSEQIALDAWMESVHHVLHKDAQRYAAAKKAREERIARAKERRTQLGDDDSTDPVIWI